jgi:hypothetical protein
MGEIEFEIHFVSGNKQWRSYVTHCDIIYRGVNKTAEDSFVMSAIPSAYVPVCPHGTSRLPLEGF